MRAVASVTSRDDDIDGRCRHLEMMSCFAARVAGDAGRTLVAGPAHDPPILVFQPSEGAAESRHAGSGA